jgi:phenylpropionate dioxygenase-like ring-hydroxylating dioxygenase large terminal subunit
MDLEREERHELPWLYPNTHFLGTADTFWWLTMFPEGAGQTRITVNSTFHKDVLSREDFDALAAKYYRRLDITNVEDNDIVELQQKGAELRNYVPGRFSALERNVHLFANYVLDRVVGGNYAERYARQVDRTASRRKTRAKADDGAAV